MLVAHAVPPYAEKIETMADDEVKQQVMEVLHTMFDQVHTPNNQKAPPAPQLIQPDAKKGSTPASSSSQQDLEWEDEEKEPAANEEKGAASDVLEPLLSDLSDEDADNRKLSRCFRQLQLDHMHEEERAVRPPDNNNRWRTRKVCEPQKMIVTRWGRDPFAQGAYSFSRSTQTHAAHFVQSGWWQLIALSCWLILRVLHCVCTLAALILSCSGLRPEHDPSTARARATRSRHQEWTREIPPHIGSAAVCRRGNRLHGPAAGARSHAIRRAGSGANPCSCRPAATAASQRSGNRRVGCSHSSSV